MKERDLLEVDCRGCDTQPDLRRQECLAGVLLSFDSRMKIETIALSGREVKRYSRRSVELLMRMRSILDSLFSLKVEVNQRLETEKSRKELKACSRCENDPRRVFEEMGSAFLRDMAEFLSQLRDVLELPTDNASARCELCILQAKRDALLILEEALSLRRYALKEGFGIVEG